MAWLLAVLVIVRRYVHGPGGSVTGGLLHENVGCLVKSTSFTLRVGLTSRSQLRTGKETTCSWALPWWSRIRARKYTTVRSGRSEST